MHHHHQSERTDSRRKPRFPRLDLMQRRRRADRLLEEDEPTMFFPGRGQTRH